MPGGLNKVSRTTVDISMEQSPSECFITSSGGNDFVAFLPLPVSGFDFQYAVSY